MLFFFVFKQKTAYELRISDWSSDVCSSDLVVSRSVTLGQTVAGDAELFRVANLSRVSVTVALSPADAGKVRPGSEIEIVSGDRRRSEERRVGKEGVSKCRSRWSPYH